MSKRDTVRRIAEAAGVSPSTVHRALTNCGNVDPRTKARILEAAGALRNEPSVPDTLPLGVLMRARPRYFWGPAFTAIRRTAEALDIPMATAICGDYENDTDFLYCLDTLQTRHAGVFLIVPGSLPACNESFRRLTDLAAHSPVIFLCESHDIPGRYYVGSDPEADGRDFATAVQPLMPQGARVLVIGCGECPIADTRCDAFLKTAAAHDPSLRVAGRIDMSFSENIAAAPALLARRIDEQYHGAFDTVFVSQGVLPQVASALYKLRLHGKVRCFGCENPPANGPFIENGTIHAVLEQDIAGQAVRAAEVAAALRRGETVPHEQYIPSRVLIFENT